MRKLSSPGKIPVIQWTSDSLEKEVEYSEGCSITIFHIAALKRYCFWPKPSMKMKSKENSLRQTRFISQLETLRSYIASGSRGFCSIGYLNSQDVTVGNSAGEIIPAKGGWGDGKFYTGFNLVDFYVSTNYKLNTGHVAETKGAINVNIPENMWVTVT